MDDTNPRPRPLRACLVTRTAVRYGQASLALQRQREAGLAYIADQGWTCDPAADVITLVSSAWHTHADRALSARLAEATLDGRYDVVVVDRPDRLGRRHSDVATFLAQMAHHRVKVALVSSGTIYDPADPIARSFAVLLATENDQTPTWRARRSCP